MKISHVESERLQAMTAQQKYELVFGEVKDDGESAAVALLLGSTPAYARDRALAAARLYRLGRVQYIVASGGVEWDFGDGKMLSEAHYMSRVLQENGVPQEAVILDNEARTTVENMICGALQINRKTLFRGDKGVVIVTSGYHMRRSMALAKTFLPSMTKLSACPSDAERDRSEWESDAKKIQIMDGEIGMMKALVENGIIDDFEVELS